MEHFFLILASTYSLVPQEDRQGGDQSNTKDHWSNPCIPLARNLFLQAIRQPELEAGRRMECAKAGQGLAHLLHPPQGCAAGWADQEVSFETPCLFPTQFFVEIVRYSFLKILTPQCNIYLFGLKVQSCHNVTKDRTSSPVKSSSADRPLGAGT